MSGVRAGARAARWCLSAAFAFTLGAAVCVHALEGQVAGSGPGFEVVSIRPLPDDASPFPPLRIGPGWRLEGRGSLETLIRMAYGLQTTEALAGPPINSRVFAQRFEVAAIPSNDSALLSRESTLMMTQRMLAERFGLRVRMDSVIKRVSVLRQDNASVLGRGLRPFTGECRALPRGARLGDPQFDEAYKSNCFVTIHGGRVRGTTNTLAEFAGLLSFLAQRPIIDGTGLTGRYQVDMTFAIETLAVGIQSRSDAPAFADALRAELGLIMRTEQRPARVLFVEHVGELVEN